MKMIVAAAGAEVPDSPHWNKWSWPHTVPNAGGAVKAPAPGQLALLLSIGFQMNLKSAPGALRMLVTMLRKAGTKSPAGPAWFW